MVIEDLYRHERKLIMVERIDAINFRRNQYNNNGDFSKGDIYLNSIMENTPLNKINSLAIEHTGNPVEEDDKTEPQKKNTNVPIFTKDDLMRVINGMYCGDSELRNEINMALAENGSYQATYSIGSIPFTVTFTKDDDGKITAEYDMPEYEVVQANKGDEVVFNSDKQEEFDAKSRELTNPQTKEARKAQLRQELATMLEQQYLNTVSFKGIGDKGSHLPTQVKDAKARAKETVAQIERLARFERTELVPRGSVNIHEIRHAQERLEKNNYEKEEDRAADLELANRKQLSIASQAFVNNHKYLFFEYNTEAKKAAKARLAANEYGDDLEARAADEAILAKPDEEFSSDLFKKFAATLTGGDGYLSVAERKELHNMFAMRATEAAHKAQMKLDENNGDMSKLTPGEKELLQNKKLWNEGEALIVSPLGAVQAAIVKDAGLAAQDNYRGLLTAVSILASLGGLAFNLSGIGMKQVQEAHVLVNGQEIPFVNGQTLDLSQYFVPGQTNTFAASLSQSQSQMAAFIPPILFGSQQSQTGVPAADCAGKSFKQDAIKGSVELTCICDEPQNPTDENVTVIHDNQGNEVKFTGCAEDGERGCGDVTRGNIVHDATPDEIKAKYGDNYDKNKTYKVSLQRWQLERAFGIDKAPKELRPILRKAMIEQVLGGNTVVPTGKNVTLLTCFDYIDKNGNVQKWDMDEQGRGHEYWQNMKPDVYSLDANVKYISGRTIPTVHVKDGHADATVTVNGVSRTFSADALDGNGETAIQMVKDQILKAYPEHPEYADAAVAKMRECQQNPKCK